MNSKGLFWCAILLLLLASCSSDDDIQDSELSSSSFRLIGEDEESVFQYNYDGDTESGQLLNLTESDNVDRQYLTLRQASNFLSFFTFSRGSFSLVQKNVDTGARTAVDNFYSIISEQSIIWGASSEDQIFMAYYSPPSTSQLGIRVIQMDSGDFSDFSLASNVADTTEPMYYEQRLFITYEDNTGRYHLIIFNTETFTIDRIFDFENLVPGLLVNQDGDLILFKGNSESSYTMELYDLQTYDLITTSDFQLNQFFVGPLLAYAESGDLYYPFTLAQPSPVEFTPAILDLTSGLNNSIDILSLLEPIRQEIGGEIDLTAFGADLENRIFQLGYRKLNSEEIFEGGVILISTNGDLLKVIELPIIPTYFIKP